MTAALQAAIAVKLKHGPQWVRSFNHAPQVLAEMRRRGFVESATPAGGAGANMVKLTDEGRVHFFKDNYALTRIRRVAETRRNIDQFADLLAAGYSGPAAAKKLGKAQQTGSVWFKRIVEGLGYQAQRDAVGPDLTAPDMAAFLAGLRARRAAEAQP